MGFPAPALPAKKEQPLRVLGEGYSGFQRLPLPWLGRWEVVQGLVLQFLRQARGKAVLCGVNAVVADGTIGDLSLEAFAPPRVFPSVDPQPT